MRVATIIDRATAAATCIEPRPNSAIGPALRRLVEPQRKSSSGQQNQITFFAGYARYSCSVVCAYSLSDAGGQARSLLTAPKCEAMMKAGISKREQA